jgi:hypothetical protein
MATIALGLLSIPPAAGQAAPAGQRMSEQAFKDVTVLKGIPVDECMNTMGFIITVPIAMPNRRRRHRTSLGPISAERA